MCVCVCVCVIATHVWLIVHMEVPLHVTLMAVQGSLMEEEQSMRLVSAGSHVKSIVFCCCSLAACVVFTSVWEISSAKTCHVTLVT